LNNQKIENIVFDLGGVIINLDMDHAFDRFSQLFGRDVRSKMMEDLHNHGFFQQFEIGEISEEEFRDSLRKFTHSDLDDKHLDLAWNAMLGDIPKERIEWINDMAGQYNIAILSNTNSIHIKRFNEIFNQSSIHNHPGDVFHKTYYSHEIHDRKPNKSCFQHVIEDFNIRPENTLFLDDNTDNIKTAGELGIKTVLVEKNMLRRDQLPNGGK
jgi:putative hydrolase of the HAD superfamily